MKKIIDFSIEHPVSVLMYFCLAMLLGIVAPFLIDLNFLPEAKDRFIIVSVNYQGARAKEIRRLITIPLEENLSSVKGVKNIDSVSRDGKSVIKIELKWNVDADNALLETKALLDACADSLPQDCPKATAQKAFESDESAIKILVMPQNNDIAQASAFVKSELKQKILSIEEASRVKCFGITSPEIKISVDPNLSSYYGLSIEEIAQNISLSNFDYPAGTVQDGQNDILLKTEGSFKNFSDILETSLKTNEGPLKLKHLATVKKADKDFDSFCFYNGEPCCELLAFCKKNRSPIALSKRIKKIIRECQSENSNYKFIIENDSSEEIMKTAKNLALNALVGVFVAVLLLLAFFKSIKIALCIAAVIPFSLLFTSAALLALKRSLNIMSISGMTICLGMIVDNSIVAIESATKKVKEKKFIEALKEAFYSIRLSNTASTTTSAIVFLPIFFIGGIIGELFLDLAISVMSGLFLSLLHSFTVLPALCVLFLKKDLQKAKAFDISWLEKHRQKILQRTNKINFLCPALAALFLLFCAAILIPIKKEFQPKTREKFLCEKILFPCGTSLKLVASRTRALCGQVQEIDGVKSAFAWGGCEKDDLEFLSDCENKKESVFIKIHAEDIKRCKKAVKEILDGLRLDHASLESEDLISERLQISDKCILTSQDQDQDRLLAECRECFGEKNFFPNEISAQRTFVANKNYMNKLNVSPYALAKSLRDSFNGAAASYYYENGIEIPITVKYDKNACANVLLGKSPAALLAFGEWKKQTEEAALFRHNGKDAKIIKKAAAKKAPKELKPRLLWIQGENLKAIFLDGVFLLALVLVLLYCVLGAQTESLKLPLYYLTAVPPSFFGAAFVLFVFGSSLNINTIIAFMLLFGTSVNNAIILHESGGKSVSAVFITSATSIASLLPFAVDPFRMNPQSSLSLAVAGGLAFSAAAVLVMTPNILFWSEK